MNGQLQTLNAALAPSAQEAERKLLLFSLGHEMYGIPIPRIKEIIEYGGVTRVPMTPAQICGVINLRGSVVPVIDLAARLGKGRLTPDRRSCIVVIEVAHEDEIIDIGVVVDAVNEVLDVDPGEIQPAPSFGASVREDFIAGMGKVNSRFIIILDEERTFAMNELAEMREAAEVLQ